MLMRCASIRCGQYILALSILKLVYLDWDRSHVSLALLIALARGLRSILFLVFESDATLSLLANWLALALDGILVGVIRVLFIILSGILGGLALLFIPAPAYSPARDTV